MKQLKIRHKRTNEVLAKRDANLTHIDLGGADLTYADLTHADLRGTNLSGADLRYANLKGILGNNKEIKTLQLGVYITVISKHGISIGCEQHTLEEWKEFTDEDISAMDDGALEWWTTWKDVIFRVVEETKEQQNQIEVKVVK